ncbi:MAG: Transcription elongation factor [Marinobacter excellens HL-55]|uniref:Transcription elongation factor GreA n=1 Tax=Marinobacter excellens HL-55 TaxID=1305731 RepID=A0A0N8KK81_9GAMM|nr:MAG: Transcription elongation factor [Marinobacter excellens HL-55]
MNKNPGSTSASARYITADGERALREELQYLWKVKRPEVTQAVREAAAQGDRSENAETAKKPLKSYYYSYLIDIK